MSRKNNLRIEQNFKVNSQLNKLIILLILSIFMTTCYSNIVTGLPTNISSCQTISSSGEYILNQSINSSGTCFTIAADNVELDCNGFNIKYNTAGGSTLMGINAILGTSQMNNLTIKNCIIEKGSNLQTAGYGIRLTRFSNSKLVNNTIITNGTTNNYGIYLTTNSQNNRIENNTIYSAGSSSGNIGVYLLSASSNNIIKHNSINTFGTTTSYGIMISTDSHNNLIEKNNLLTYGSTGATTSSYGIYLTTRINNTIITRNNIRTNGVGSRNYGLYLQNNIYSSQVLNNNISTNGSSTNHGIYVIGAASTPSNNNSLELNNIYTNGITANNYGIYLLTNTNNNIIRNNSINTYGSSTNHGIYISGVTSSSNYNEISINKIFTNGTAGSNYGIYLYRNANFNNISNNTVNSNGTSSNHGIYGIGTTGLTINNNIIKSNIVNASGYALASTNYGIHLSTFANNNTISNNLINTMGSTGNYGIYVLGTTALESNNNNILSNVIITRGTTTNNYGIRISTNTNNAWVDKNIISTNGSSGNIGIYVSAATTSTANNIQIINNNIVANGSSSGNYGIHLLTNVNTNFINNNNISTMGTTTNYGIYISGSTKTSNNGIVTNNNIYAQGSGASNHGIYLYRNVSNMNISNNNIFTNGTSTNYGIYGAGTATHIINNNSLNNNNISTLGTTTNNYGIYLLTNNNNNLINNNNISTMGTTGNTGITISGTTSSSINNSVTNNLIRTKGTTTGHGIYLTTNTLNNSILQNNILTNGTTTSYGIYLLGTSGNPTDNNKISNNTIRTACYDASSNCYGIFLQNNIANNNISSNIIETTGTLNDFGIYLFGTAPLPVQTNLFTKNNLNVTSGDVIRINSGAKNNTFNANNITNRNIAYYDINILSAELLGTIFVDQEFQKYNFGGLGEQITIKNSNYGEIVFNERITGNNDLSNKIIFNQNYVFVNSSVNELNVSANISLYNVANDYPAVYRDNSICVDCYIISQQENIISFYVPHFSAYSLGDNAYLEIFDDSDFSESVGPLKFYANYTNITSNQAIDTGECNITISETSSVMNYNASTLLYEYFELLVPGIYSYNITCVALGYSSLNASDIAIIANFSGPISANVTIINTERANITYLSSEKIIQSGNVTQANIESTTSSNSWQGYFGTTKGNIVLSNNKGAIFYDWNIVNPNGEVYATRTNDVNFATIGCSNEAEQIAEETFIGQLATDSDSVRKTFNNNVHPAFNVGSVSIDANECNSTNIFVNGTYQTTSFFELLLSDSSSNIIYTAIIDWNQTGFNYQNYDFQMLVGENNNISTTTSYYFFVEIQ